MDLTSLTFRCFVPADVCKPGWSYFGGICYSTSQTCKNWTEAQSTCQSYSANLISVRNQEENVYIQHRLNGARGWIGLSDRDTEGTFVWADNQTNNFTYWAKNQPNNFNNEDCVHTLGVGHSFMWNDVSCETCHNYTCSEGTVELIIIIIIIIIIIKLWLAIKECICTATQVHICTETVARVKLQILKFF